MIHGIDLNGWFFKLLFKYRIKCNVFLFNGIIHILCFFKKVRIGKNVKFNGFPKVYRFPDSKIIFGNNCLFNSSKNSIIVGLQKPCTFFTFLKGSEIIIGDNSGASGATIIAANSIRIGNNVMIGANSTIIDNDFHSSDPSQRTLDAIPAKPIIIEDNVFMGFNCMVLKGVTIGENSVIGANSVVISSIPKNSIAMGNPCKVIIQRNWSGSQPQ
jgi:acetyltransferase-like isoleucine patch superfamily enzyme